MSPARTPLHRPRATRSRLFAAVLVAFVALMTSVAPAAADWESGGGGGGNDGGGGGSNGRLVCNNRGQGVGSASGKVLVEAPFYRCYSKRPPESWFENYQYCHTGFEVWRFYGPKNDEARAMTVSRTNVNDIVPVQEMWLRS